MEDYTKLSWCLENSLNLILTIIPYGSCYISSKSDSCKSIPATYCLLHNNVFKVFYKEMEKLCQIQIIILGLEQ